MTQQRRFAVIARKETTTVTMKQDREEHIEERVGQKQKPDTGQFRLQVDRQTKRSYATYDAAIQDGTAIKNSYPLLRVAVYDRLASAETIIELPKSGNE
jgi:hypothetical protein